MSETRPDTRTILTNPSTMHRGDSVALLTRRQFGVLFCSTAASVLLGCGGGGASGDSAGQTLTEGVPTTNEATSETPPQTVTVDTLGITVDSVAVRI